MMEVPAKEGSEGGLLTQPSPERGAVVEGDSDSDSDSGGVALPSIMTSAHVLSFFLSGFAFMNGALCVGRG